MKPTILLTLAFIIITGLSGLQAQDKIIKRDGAAIHCKVIEVGTSEIKYGTADYDFQVLFSIERILVDKIIFENGQELFIDHAVEAMKGAESNSADLFLVQNKNAIKINFLSPMAGGTNLSYERALKPGQSVEVSLGLIGLAFENPDNAMGVGFSVGYKFIRSPDYYLEGMRYAHILKGGYVRPEFSLASYELKNQNRHVTKGAILLNIGKQWVYSDVFLVDLYVGIGYGYADPGNLDHYPYDFAVAKNPPVAFNWGLRIGFLL